MTKMALATLRFTVSSLKIMYSMILINVFVHQAAVDVCKCCLEC